MKYLDGSDTEVWMTRIISGVVVGKSSIETVCITFIELEYLQAGWIHRWRELYVKIGLSSR